jgi:multicomponent Na+:H+ antiporter subunit F
MRWGWRHRMAEFLLAMAGCVLLSVLCGLVRVLRGPADADRMMAVQLIGSGSIAALLLLASAMGDASAIDVALCLALVAAFASVAFALGLRDGAGE